MKSKNKIYVLVTFLLIVGVGFFFSTKAWLPDDRTQQNLNYDTLLSIGDWSAHVGAAVYTKESDVMSCVVYERSSIDNPQPFTVTAYLGNPSQKKVLPSSMKTEENNPDLTDLEIKNIPKNYYYVTLVFTAANSEVSTENSASSSIYGNNGYDSQTTNAVSETSKTDVKIDYRIALKNAKIAASSVGR